MRILVAEDEFVSRRILGEALTQWGYSVVNAADGNRAWEIFQAADAPSLGILDWMMPAMDGLAVCRKVRESHKSPQPYLLLVTQREGKANIIQGLQAGANDYLTKPYDFDELRARLQVGERMLQLQQELAERVRELESSLAHIKQLQGLLPICAHCKKVRDDQDYWQSVESYLHHHGEVKFTHTICPDCFRRICEEMKLKATFPGRD